MISILIQSLKKIINSGCTCITNSYKQVIIKISYYFRNTAVIFCEKNLDALRIHPLNYFASKRFQLLKNPIAFLPLLFSIGFVCFYSFCSYFAFFNMQYKEKACTIVTNLILDFIIVRQCQLL